MRKEYPEHLDIVDLDFLNASDGAEREYEDPALSSGLLVKATPGAASRRLSDLHSDAFNALSLEDQEKATRKMYGISEVGSAGEHEDIGSSKSPLFVEEKLQEMETELQRLRTSSSWSLSIAAIELAESQSPAYVQNPKFRLRFLQAEEWDATEAAARFIRHFDYKMDLFGGDCVARDVNIGDLSQAEHFSGGHEPRT